MFTDIQKDFIEKNHIEKLDYLKIDIEGAESSIIPHIQDILLSMKPVLHLLIHGPYLNNFESDIQNILDVIQLAREVYFIEFNSDQPVLVEDCSLLKNKIEFYDVFCVF